MYYSKFYTKCEHCQKIIQINKPIIKSLHFCTSENKQNKATKYIVFKNNIYVRGK